MDPLSFLGGVVLAVVVNLISVYLKGPLDRLLGSVSRRWATRTQRQRTEREQRVALLAESAEARLEAHFVEIRHRLEMLVGMAFVGLLWTFVLFRRQINLPDWMTIVSSILGIIALMAAMDLLRRATTTRDELRDAKRRDA
jgi:hypothetical protein